MYRGHSDFLRDQSLENSYVGATPRREAMLIINTTASARVAPPTVRFSRSDALVAIGIFQIAP